MKKLIGLAILLVLGPLFVSGQTMRVTLRVKEVYSNVSKSCGTEGDYEHTINFNYGIDGGTINAWPASCMIRQTSNSPITVTDHNVSTSFYATEKFALNLKGFEGTNGGGCDYTGSCKGDMAETTRTYLLENYTPGVNHTLYITWGKFYVKVNLYYTIPSPNSLSISNTGILCPEEEQTLTIDYPVIPNATNLKFDYEYRVGDETVTVLEPNTAYCGPCSGGVPLSAPDNPGSGSTGSGSTGSGPSGSYRFSSDIPGTEKFITVPTTSPCCDEPPFIEVVKEKWRVISTGNTSKQLNITPGQLSGIDTLSENTRVTFRARATAGSYKSGYRSRSVTVSPPAPVFDSYQAVASCPNGRTGSVTFNNIYGTTYEYKYIIQTEACTSPFDDACLLSYVAHDTFSIEKPRIIAGPTGPFLLGAVATSHTVEGRNLTINGLGPGDYIVYLTNVGGTKGECYTRTDFTIPAWPYPDVTLAATKNISCHGGSDGTITVAGSGGKPGVLTYSIMPEAGTFDAATKTFSGLPAGTYLITLTDECGEKTTVSTTLTQPTRVTASVYSEAPDCYDPANGWISVTAAAGSGSYNYALFNGTLLVSQSNNTTETSWLVNALPGNTYTVQVRDALRPACEGFDSTFVIKNPEPLALTVTGKTDLSCFGSGDGSISLSGSGGTGNLTYYIKNTGTNAISNNTTGIFEGLPAGSYAAWVRNTGTRCNDQFDLPGTITLTQPPQITVSLTAYNITCTDEDNGAIKAHAAGGTGTLSYRWEYNTGGGWFTIGGETTDSISGRFPARYRVWITDELACFERSGEITLVNPGPLVITEVVRNRPACFGDTDGTLSPVATGGWGRYQYTYSADGGTNWHELLPGSTFGFGDFRVAVTDAEGCYYEFPETISFTAPGQALGLSLSAPTHNGYEVSCAGGDDGVIEIAATGGVPLAGETYTYYLNGTEQGSSPTVSGLTAGTYTVGVQDAYRCYQESTIILREPEALHANLTAQTDVMCYGDNTGMATFSLSGGVAPYTYTLDGQAVATTQLENLTAQAYTFAVTDANGCTIAAQVVIKSLYPPILISFDTQDVTCYNGDDGHISASLSGGAAPYTYEWEGHTDNTASLERLSTGWYTLQVTDAKGCKAIDSVFIAQPENIDIGEDVTICRGQEFRLDATHPGATGYAWTGPAGFSSNEATPLATQSGTYSVTVSTAQGCTLTDAMQLTVSEEYFEALFVASTYSALGDTVELIEVSYPLPARVEWDFGTGITVVDDNPARPRIIFNQTGDYSIGMTAWYAGCVDSLRKTLTSLPPEEITVSEPAAPVVVSLIEEASAYPNPNNGQFNVSIALNEISTVTLLVYNLYGEEVARKRGDGSDAYDIPIEINPATPGAYLLTVIAQDQRFDTKVIIQ
ncbi:T9SS type A sorting domain-containing protein [Roseivirga sp. BDSF3-8]|uniref:T9SS type A sorting domain-containing protein n=1 Tax=Roseivirga sp. BDSF3-8 TaxID=3241598 RepID=UPI00353276F1